ncbi:MAG: hypothetical protein HFJ45_10420 [Clostridia bacterium]|nr:hypothetical protein [Clostridia bacterium]
MKKQHLYISRYTIINSNDYSYFDKHSDDIFDKYTTYYTELTNFDVHLWGNELFFLCNG